MQFSNARYFGNRQQRHDIFDFDFTHENDIVDSVEDLPQRNASPFRLSDLEE